MLGKACKRRCRVLVFAGVQTIRAAALTLSSGCPESADGGDEGNQQNSEPMSIGTVLSVILVLMLADVSRKPVGEFAIGADAIV
jgi:hypothetical protein